MDFIYRCTHVGRPLRYFITPEFNCVLTSTLLFSFIFSKQEKYTEARDVLKDISTKNLDWPEAIWEAWLTFEHIHGSMTDLEACMDKIERAQQQVNTRLAKVGIRVGEA